MYEISTINGIQCYEVNGVAHLDLEAVARGLGFTQEKNAVEYVRWETVNGYLSELGFPSKLGKGDFIPENIFYRLAMKAKNETAERFQALVADEVIPAIRKHGAYMTPQTLDRMIQSPEFGIKLLTALKEERGKRERLEAKVEALKPMERYVEEILSSKGTLTTTQIAADYNISARRLNRILCEERIQRKVNNQWILYHQHMGKGYTESETIQITRSDGRPDTVMHTRWTQTGRLAIHEILKKRGISAVMVRKEASAV